MRKLTNHSGYLDELDYEIAAHKATMAVEKLRDFQCDAIAFTGMSGAIMAPMIAVALKRPMILVRRNGDGSHSGRIVEGALDALTYLIVDDFVSSGDTITRIYNQIRVVSPNAKCVGVYSYRYNTLNTHAHPDRDCVRAIVSPIVDAPKPQTVPCAFTGFPMMDAGEANMAACEQA